MKLEARIARPVAPGSQGRCRRLPFGLALALIAIGLGVSEYIFARTLLLATGPSVGRDWCSEIFRRGCDATLRDGSWELLGLPLAGWGVVYFGGVGLLLVLGWALDALRALAQVLAFVAATVAALAGVWLTTLFARGNAPFCPLCQFVHLLNWALVPLLWFLVRGTIVTELRGLRRPSLLIAAALIGVTATAAGLYAWAGHTWSVRGTFDPARVLADFESAPVLAIPLHEDDPGRGPPEALVRLVLFSDFQCPACREFAAVLSGVAQRFPLQLSIDYKHYPLSTDCHPRLKHDLHPGSCQAAWAAEAARRQNRFWSFHDLLIRAPVTVSDALVQAVARESGLDPIRFDADRADPAVHAKVRADLELGATLGVDGTPSVFLDGRRVRDLRARSLEFLIATRIEAAAAGR